ncbi:MAG: Gfo/Idh/MocA family protein [Chthoniobacterales bacterium]
MRSNLRVALIGTQFMGRAHSNAWRQIQPFFEPERVPELAVVCGRDLAKTEAFARQWGWREAVADWREVVTRDDIDAVDLSLPQHLQAEVAIVAAEHGKHIFCEKPMAMNPEEAHAMSRAAIEAGVVHAVNYNYRRAPAVALARQIIDEGRIGTIFHWRGAYLQDWLRDPETPSGWKLQKQFAGSGPHGDLNSHSVDLARYLVGEIVEVSCHRRTFIGERPSADDPAKRVPVDIDDASQLLVSFANGAMGSFEASRFATGNRNANQFEIYGSRGALRWNLEDLNRLEFYSDDDPPHLRGFRQILVTEPCHPYVGRWWPPGHVIGYEHTFVHSIADFLAAVAGQSAYRPDFRDGARVLEILDAARKADESSASVKLAPSGQG